MLDAAPSHRHTPECLGRGCDHPVDVHLATPELSTIGEAAVVWCAQCRRHEVRRQGWRHRLGLGAGRNLRRARARSV